MVKVYRPFDRRAVQQLTNELCSSYLHYCAWHASTTWERALINESRESTISDLVVPKKKYIKKMIIKKSVKIINK